ncbi:uncharacterized protein NECHADRAFT_43326, partial [Fusarium vanettenii 77-13-4]
QTMGKYGYLIPDSYVREVPGEVDMNTASIFWGFSLGVAVFSAGKAGKQSWRSWKRARRPTAYVGMVWAVWFSSMVLGALAWGFQRQYIDPRQVDALYVFLPLCVFIIWMPARLQINDTWVHLNEIWDRCEKVIFALVDGALNGYFIYLVRSRLIENGLTKYTPLYRMNLVLIFVSLSLDVVLVGLMSMKSSLVYLSFHPVCYLLKLQIEMKMAELITKIVRSTGRHGSDDIYYRQSSTGDKSKTARGTTKAKFSTGLSGAQGTFKQGNTTQIEAGDQDSDIEMEIRDRATDGGIIKTTHTTVASSPVDIREDDDSHSRTSSTRQLHY